MPVQRFFCFLFLFLFLACPALGESRVVNLFADPEAVYQLREDVPILEIDFPSIAGCDACLLRMEGQTMLIDAGSTSMASMSLLPMLRSLGITHVDIAFNTHPHDDHIDGFLLLLESGITFGEFQYCQDPSTDWRLQHTLRIIREAGIPTRRMVDGDVVHFGRATVSISERKRTDFTLNDLSGVTLVEYGECRYLGTGDIENRAQSMFLDNPPAAGMQAQILKHPHHGYARMVPELLDMIQPELCILTGLKAEISQAVRFLEQKSISWIRPWENPIRIRCDGNVFIVDPLLF